MDAQVRPQHRPVPSSCPHSSGGLRTIAGSPSVGLGSAPDPTPGLAGRAWDRDHHPSAPSTPSGLAGRAWDRERYHGITIRRHPVPHLASQAGPGIGRGITGSPSVGTQYPIWPRRQGVGSGEVSRDHHPSAPSTPSGLAGRAWDRERYHGTTIRRHPVPHLASQAGRGIGRGITGSPSVGTQYPIWPRRQGVGSGEVSRDHHPSAPGTPSGLAGRAWDRERYHGVTIRRHPVPHLASQAGRGIGRGITGPPSVGTRGHHPSAPSTPSGLAGRAWDRERYHGITIRRHPVPHLASQAGRGIGRGITGSPSVGTQYPIWPRRQGVGSGEVSRDTVRRHPVPHLASQAGRGIGRGITGSPSVGTQYPIWPRRQGVGSGEVSRGHWVPAGCIWGYHAVSRGGLVYSMPTTHTRSPGPTKVFVVSVNCQSSADPPPPSQNASHVHCPI